MKILLVRFGELTPEDNPYDRTSISRKRGVYPPMGLAQIAAVLEDMGHEVGLFDYAVTPFTAQELERWIRDNEPMFLGLGAWTTTLRDDLEPLAWIKELFPDLPVVLGGPHATLFPVETLERFSTVDYVVYGEGEVTVRELAGALEKGESVDGIRGLVWRDGESVVRGKPRPPIEDLDSIPHPAFHLLDFSRYSNALQKMFPSTYLITTRGCPFKCTYCVKPVWEKRNVRFNSVEYVLEQMEIVVRRYGVREIHFFDDTFTASRRRTMDICRGVIERGLDFNWIIRTRVDTVDDEMLAMLRKAGCTMISFGVESGSDEILEAMKRGMTLETVREKFALARKHGFETAANFMIGFPGESMRTYRDTVRVAKELGPDFAQFGVTTGLHGSELYREAMEKGWIKGDPWREFATGELDTIDPDRVRFAGEDYTIADLDDMLIRAYREFYLRPSVVWNLLKRIRSVDQIRMYARLAASVLWD